MTGYGVRHAATTAKDELTTPAALAIIRYCYRAPNCAVSAWVSVLTRNSGLTLTTPSTGYSISETDAKAIYRPGSPASAAITWISTLSSEGRLPRGAPGTRSGRIIGDIHCRVARVIRNRNVAAIAALAAVAAVAATPTSPTIPASAAVSAIA